MFLNTNTCSRRSKAFAKYIPDSGLCVTRSRHRQTHVLLACVQIQAIPPFPCSLLSNQPRQISSHTCLTFHTCSQFTEQSWGAVGAQACRSEPAFRSEPGRRQTIRGRTGRFPSAEPNHVMQSAVCDLLLSSLGVFDVYYRVFNFVYLGLQSKTWEIQTKCEGSQDAKQKRKEKEKHVSVTEIMFIFTHFSLICTSR